MLKLVFSFTKMITMFNLLLLGAGLPAYAYTGENENYFMGSYHYAYYHDYGWTYGDFGVASYAGYAEPEPEPVFYEVRSGDTLYRIANSFGIQMSEIIMMNGLANPNFLYIGQKLQIPGLERITLGGESTVTQVFAATLTAYTAGYESTGKTEAHPAYGITFSGTRVQEGRTVAVDPSIVPLGSTLYIEGVGIRKAEDTGKAIRGRKIDVYIEDLHEARSFGVKPNVNVYVLKNKAI
jgi:3D (Asp-Asp-Asp) domain-containing protein